MSLSESLDTATPAGRMVSTVLGAVAELERSLIVERVKAGLRNARAKGRTFGRPRVLVDARRIAALRKNGASWATVCQETGLSKGTAQRALHSLPKSDLRVFLRRLRTKKSRSYSQTHYVFLRSLTATVRTTNIRPIQLSCPRLT